MIQVAELKRAVGIATTDESRNTDLASAEKAAVASVENLVGRWFGAIEETTEYPSGGGVNLWLTEKPVAVEDVLVTLSEQSSDGTWTEVDAADYEIRNYALRKLSGCWTKGRGNFRAVYSRGYVLGEEPADVRGMVLAVMAILWRRQTDSGKKSETFGTGYSYTAATAADQEISVTPGMADFIGFWRWL